MKEVNRMKSKIRLLGNAFPGLSDRLFFLCGVLMLGSELWKQLTLTFSVGGGAYNWWYFPFQLCSIPMYVLLLYPWFRQNRIRRALLTFLMCYGLLGGLAAFADQSGLHYPAAPLTLHSYLWHILLILVGVGAGITYGRLQPSPSFRRPFPLRPFLHATALYLGCCCTAEVLNLTLDRFGTINMFYINPNYPMQQIVFRDLIPYLGNIPVILLYIAASILGAFLLFLVWKIVFHFFRY